MHAPLSHAFTHAHTHTHTHIYIYSQRATRVKPFICTMPMRLDEGWNQIQFNLSDFTRRAYGTNYIETLRVQIHSNCRIRRYVLNCLLRLGFVSPLYLCFMCVYGVCRIYFSDRLYAEEDLPPEFKLFLPVQVCVYVCYVYVCCVCVCCACVFCACVFCMDRVYLKLPSHFSLSLMTCLFVSLPLSVSLSVLRNNE